MKKQNNEKGLALLTTLILGFIALGFIAALLYMLTSETRTSGTTARYTTALEAAKGGADMIIIKILNDDITCGGNTCPDPATMCQTDLSNCKIDLQIPNLGSYQLDAYLIGRQSITYAGSNYIVYAVRIIAKNPEKKEKAEIEFVYRVE